MIITNISGYCRNVAHCPHVIHSDHFQIQVHLCSCFYSPALAFSCLWFANRLYRKPSEWNQNRCTALGCSPTPTSESLRKGEGIKPREELPRVVIGSLHAIFQCWVPYLSHCNRFYSHQCWLLYQPHCSAGFSSWHIAVSGSLPATLPVLFLPHCSVQFPSYETTALASLPGSLIATLLFFGALPAKLQCLLLFQLLCSIGLQSCHTAGLGKLT